MGGAEGTMQDLMNTILLICAAAAAMGFGVLLAYASCKAMFAAFRIHARSHQNEAARVKPQTVRAS